MRLLTITIFLLITATGFSQTSDSMIRGVRVEFDYSLSIFPGDWQLPPISASGQPIDKSEIPRTRRVMERALSKYPIEMLEENLESIHFLSQMRFFDVPYGGTNSNTAVYLVNNGRSLGYSNKYLEQTFHHEFSSILLRNFPEFLDTTLWKSLNDPGFNYNDPENGVGAIRNNQSSQDIDSILCEKGLLTQYASSSIENDVNTFAQNLFLPEKDFWKNVETYPRIKKKMEMLVEFYQKINPVFTLEYFRKFSPDQHKS